MPDYESILFPFFFGGEYIYSYLFYMKTSYESMHLNERNKIACHRCRKQKKKCSSTEPCSNCSKLNYKCVYPLESNRKPASNKYVASLLKRIEVLSEAVNKNSFIIALPNAFLFEKRDNVMSLESSHFDILDTRATWRLKFEDSKFCFMGPASGRNYELTSPRNYHNSTGLFKIGLFERLPMNSYHVELFEWYFEHVNSQIHIVSDNLFFGSFSVDNKSFGPFVSNSLINAILAITILKGPYVMDYKDFKDLARIQVFHEINTLNITSVQTLLLLAMIEMNDGNESQASMLTAMASSLSNHLGLHIELGHLVESKLMSQDELNLRKLLFWCCFVVDRMKGPILGLHPYLNVSDISITIPVQLNDADSEIFKEFCYFLDIEDKVLMKLYSLKTRFDDEETYLRKKNLYLSEIEMIIEKWKRRLPSCCRFEKDRDINSPTFLLSICYETFRILIYKPWIKYPLTNLSDKMIDDPIVICSDSAEYIIKNVTPLLVKSPFLYRCLYSLYMSSMICLFNTLSENQDIEDKYNKMITVVLEFYENISSSAEVSKIYRKRLITLKDNLHNNFKTFGNNENLVDDDFNNYLDLLFENVP